MFDRFRLRPKVEWNVVTEQLFTGDGAGGTGGAGLGLFTTPGGLVEMVAKFVGRMRRGGLASRMKSSGCPKEKFIITITSNSELKEICMINKFRVILSD